MQEHEAAFLQRFASYLAKKLCIISNIFFNVGMVHPCLINLILDVIFLALNNLEKSYRSGILIAAKNILILLMIITILIIY